MNDNVVKVVSDVTFGAVVCTYLIIVYKLAKRVL